MYTFQRSLISVKLVLLFSFTVCACSQAVRRNCHPTGDRIAITHIGNGPAPIVTHLLIYGDALVLKEDGGKTHCRIAPEAASALRKALYSGETQASLEEISRNPRRYNYLADAESIVFDLNGEEVRLVTEATPNTLVGFLELLDEELSSVFRRAYRIRLRQ